jgi:hypothetical protein
VVFKAGWTVVMLGLDVTLRTRVTAAVLRRMRDLGPLGTELLLPALDQYRSVSGPAGPPVHDVCAVALVAQPELTEAKRIMSAPRYHPAGRQRTRGPLTGCVQPEPGDVQDAWHILAGMNTTNDAPAGAGPVDRSGPAGTIDPSARSGTKRLLRWGAGITLAGFLAGGGIALAVSGSTTPATPAAGAATTANAAEVATLNSALDTAGGTTSAVPAPRVRWALGRLRALGGVHGEFTFHNKTGYHTLAFERGTIVSVSGSNVVVRAPDGTTWTWLIVSNTVVRRSGAKTTTSALSAGQTVFAGGPVINGDKDARLIVIRPGGSGSSGSGSGSSSSVTGPPGTSVS